MFFFLLFLIASTSRNYFLLFIMHIETAKIAIPPASTTPSDQVPTTLLAQAYHASGFDMASERK